MVFVCWTVVAVAGYRDWNEQFQLLLGQPTTTIENAQERAEAIKLLALDFANAAIPVVNTIVSELHLPAAAKTIQPISNIGFAGGQKFLHAGMFIKVARDERNLVHACRGWGGGKREIRLSTGC